MANLTNHINFNTSGGGGGDVTAGDAIRIDAGNEVNVKFDNTSITLNGDGELQATLPIHCIEDYPATVEGEIIINGCGCTAGELYRAGYTGDGYETGTEYVAPNASYKTNANVTSNMYQKDRTEQIQCYVGTLVNNSLQIDSGNSFTSSKKVAADTIVLGDVSIKKVFSEAIEAGSGGLATNEHASLEIPALLWAVTSSTTNSPAQNYNGSSNVWRYNGEFIDGGTMNKIYDGAAGLGTARYFTPKFLDAVQSIDSDIITVDQFTAKYILLYHGAYIESGYANNHNVTYIVLDKTSKEPVMLFSTTSGGPNNSGYANSGYISYSISKQYVTYDMYYAYPDNGTIIYLSQNSQFVDTGIASSFRPVYHFIYKSNNKIISEGNMYVGSSDQTNALSSLYVDTRLQYPGFSVSRNPAVLDHDIGDIGELGWLPVANCPEPEPEISIEAGDAIRIDDGTEVNVKFDGTTIVLNDNGELSSACCEDAYPEACVLESQPTEEGIIVQNNCGDTAGMLYKSVYRSSIPAGTNYLKIYFTGEHNIRDIVNYWNIEDIRTYTELYNKDFYDTGETVTKKVYKTVKREDENTYNGKYTYAYTQNYYLPEMITQGQLMGAPEGFRSNIFTGFDTRGGGSSSSYWVIATPQFTSNNKLNFYQITNAEALSNLYTEGFLELWMYGAKWPRADLDADRVAGAQTFLDTYDVYTRVLTTRTGNYPITMNEFYCYDKDGELKIIHSTQALQGHNIDTGQSSPKDLTVTSQLLDFHVYQSRNGYKMYYPGRLLENNAYGSTFMFFEDPAGQLMFASPIFITTGALNYNSRLYQSDYVPYTYLQATAGDQEGYYSRELYYTEDQQKVIQLGEQLTRLTDRFNTLETTLTAQIASLEERVTALENA